MKASKVVLLVQTLFLLTGLGSLIAIIILAATKEPLPLFNTGVLFVITIICWTSADSINLSILKKPQENEDSETLVP